MVRHGRLSQATKRRALFAAASLALPVGSAPAGAAATERTSRMPFVSAMLPLFLRQEGYAFLGDAAEMARDAGTSGAALPCVAKNGSWIPGWGNEPCCGVWTACGQEKYGGSLPKDLHQKLETNPALLKRVQSGLCPYGRALPGQITWPGLPADAPPELCEAVGKLTSLKVIAVIYSYLPYGVALFVIISFLVHRGTQQLWVLLWLGLMVVVSELIFKMIFHGPRPGMLMQVRDESGRYVGSCSNSCGMPSSHSALAMGWFVLLFLDATFRLNPSASSPGSYSTYSSRGNMNDGDRNLNEDDRGQSHLPLAAFLRREVRNSWKFTRFIVLVPWVHSESLTHVKFVAYVSFWFVIMVPVPFMRVALYDHTLGQAAVGSAIGPVIAIMWWRVVRYLQQRYRALEGQKFFFGLLVHNYTLPRFLRYDARGHVGSTVTNQTISFTRTPTPPQVRLAQELEADAEVAAYGAERHGSSRRAEEVESGADLSTLRAS